MTGSPKGFDKLPRLLVRRLVRRLAEGLQLLPPLRGLGCVLQSVTELHQPLQAVSKEDSGLWWDLRLVLLQALVAGQQQRLGLGVLLLAQQRATEQGLGLERGPGVGLFLRADRQAVAQDGFGFR